MSTRRTVIIENENGKKSTSKAITYTNPNIADSDAAELAVALYSLSDNNLKSVKIRDERYVDLPKKSKADPKLNVPADYTWVTTGGNAANINFTQIGDGAVSASMDKENGTFQYQISDSQITISFDAKGDGPSYSSYVLTVSTAETDTFAPATKTVNISIQNSMGGRDEE